MNLTNIEYSAYKALPLPDIKKDFENLEVALNIHNLGYKILEIAKSYKNNFIPQFIQFDNLTKDTLKKEIENHMLQSKDINFKKFFNILEEPLNVLQKKINELFNYINNDIKRVVSRNKIIIDSIIREEGMIPEVTLGKKILSEFLFVENSIKLDIINITETYNNFKMNDIKKIVHTTIDQDLNSYKTSIIKLLYSKNKKMSLELRSDLAEKLAFARGQFIYNTFKLQVLTNQILNKNIIQFVKEKTDELNKNKDIPISYSVFMNLHFLHYCSSILTEQNKDLANIYEKFNQITGVARTILSEITYREKIKDYYFPLYLTPKIYQIKNFHIDEDLPKEVWTLGLEPKQKTFFHF